MNDDNSIARTFNGLANVKRVGIFKMLLRQHPRPVLFGELSKCCSIPPSTLKHHLQEMEAAGIVSRQVSGRSTLIRLKIDKLETILRGFLSECCSAPDLEKLK